MLSLKKGTILAAAALLLFMGCKKKKMDVVPEVSNYKIKKIIVSGDDPQEYYFTYNEDNILTKTIGKGSGDWDLTQQVESDYTFDTNGNLTMVSSVFTGFEEGDWTIAVQYEYNSENRPVLQKTSYYGSAFYESKRLYYNGNEWKAEVDVSYDQDSEMYETYDSTIYYAYNSFGKPTSSKNYYSFSPLKYNEHEYSYDAYGNLITIKRRQTSDGGDWFTETRTCDHTTVASIPKEWWYFYMGMIDIVGLLDPENGTEDVMNYEYSNQVECSSTTGAVTGSSMVEKNTNGTLSRIVRNIGYMDYNTCNSSNRTYDQMFYY